MGYLQPFMVIVQDFLFGAIKLEFAWILAREKHLDPEMVRNMPIKSYHKYSSQEIFFSDSSSLSTRPTCLWRTGSTSPPWRTPSRMRTASISELLQCLLTLLLMSRSALISLVISLANISSAVNIWHWNHPCYSLGPYIQEEFEDSFASDPDEMLIISHV